MTKRLLSRYSVCKKLKNSYKNIWGLRKKEFCRSVAFSKNKRKKVTVFGKLINIKQSFKLFYSNLGECSFKRDVKLSLQSPSKTLDRLISIVESRLDSVIFRSCFVVSFHKARQVINHGFVSINGVVVTRSSKRIRKGDIVQVSSSFLTKKIFFEILTSRSVPNYLELDFKSSRVVFLWDTNFKNTYYPLKTNFFIISRYYK